MRLTALARIARSRAETLDYDATRWHRIELAALARIRQEAKARRHAEKKTTVEVPAEIVPGDTSDEPEEEQN